MIDQIEGGYTTSTNFISVNEEQVLNVTSQGWLTRKTNPVTRKVGEFATISWSTITLESGNPIGKLFFVFKFATGIKDTLVIWTS